MNGLRLYFPVLGSWVAQSISLPSFSSWFICTRMWDLLLHQPRSHRVCQLLPCWTVAALPTPYHNLLPRWVLQPPPCLESCLPHCPSPSLLLVWMNLSSLTPWLSDFHTVQFSVSSGSFLFLNCCVLLLVVRGGTVCLPTPPSCPEASVLYFN